MYNKPRILVDVDLTVVDLSKLWWKWLEIQTGKKIPFPTTPTIDYNLSKYFPDVVDSMDFWRNEGLYDMGEPIEGSVEALSALSEDYNIFFASHCKGNHFRSKYRFLERYFPFMEGFVATKEKYVVECDVVIDDRNVVLNSIHSDVLKIKYETPYTQDAGVDGWNYVVAHWCNVGSLIRRKSLKYTTKLINETFPLLNEKE